MKKHFFNPPKWRLLAALLISGISFIIYSCHKEIKFTAQEANAAKAAENFSIKEASTWFNGNKTTLANKIKLTADISFLKDLSDFTPVWDSARTALDTNYYAVEAPAKYAKKWGFNTDSNKANINGLTRLLVLKSKKYGSTSAVLMHIHGNAGVNASNVHYMAVPQIFSGNIFYTSLQGEFIYGYIYSKGKVVKSSKGSRNSTAPGGPRILQAYNPGDGNNCETITTNWYTQTCYWNADDSFDHCTVWQYLYTTVDTYCNDNNNNGGGGAVPAPPDCPEGTHPAGSDDGNGGGGDNGGLNVESVNGKLVVHFAYGSSSNCVPDTTKKKTPCDEAQLLAKDTAFKSKLKYLKSKTGQNYESSYTYTDPSDPSSYNYTQGLPDSTHINLSISNKIGGMAHVHQSNGSSVTIPVPSGDDFQTVYELLIGNKLINANTFGSTVITASSTVYMIMISDTTAFKNWSVNYGLNNNTSLFDIAVHDTALEFATNYQLNYVQSYESALLNELVGSGLKIFKGDFYNFNTWKSIKFNDTATNFEVDDDCK